MESTKIDYTNLIGKKINNIKILKEPEYYFGNEEFCYSDGKLIFITDNYIIGTFEKYPLIINKTINESKINEINIIYEKNWLSKNKLHLTKFTFNNKIYKIKIKSFYRI